MSRPAPVPAERAADRADPARVRVPTLGIDAVVLPLGLDSQGALEVPTDFTTTGWYRDGPEPGEPGPALIAGHVDSFEGPAVFYRLDEIRVGDQIHVDQVGGTTVTFAVTRVERHPKTRFPTAAVYGPTPTPQLRLVTCGGEFDDDDRRYLDNVIAFASMLS